jgi:peptidoglycan hydrolase CwlO-like protein
MEERSGRLASVEGTLEERHARLVALESTIDERDRRFAKLEADLALRTERLASLEQSMEERDRRLTAVEYAMEEKKPVALKRAIKRNGEDDGSELTNASSGLADIRVCRDDEASQSGSVPTAANGRIR